MKTGILLTVRLKSTRLKRKALLEIGGRPLIQHLVDRMKETAYHDNIVIMTSNLPEDKPLIEFADSIGVKSFAGDPVDVLVRMRDAANHFGFERVVSATGDNPFVDAKCLERAVDFQTQCDADFVSIDGIPWGTFCYVLTTRGIEIACENKNESDTEVWGDYFRKNPKLTCKVLEILDPDLAWNDLRLTVDTAEDFEMVSKVVAGVSPTADLSEIVSFCRKHPEIVAINSSIQQKAAPPAKFRKP